MTNLSNEQLTVSIKEVGAELISILDNKSGIEYLWKGDPDIWGRHSPVLFPIVGRLKENTYQSGGRTFSLPQHGFARDMDYKILSASTDKIVLSLVYSEETLKKYPYKFELRIAYSLQGRKLTTGYKVINHQNSRLYFSLGAHP